MITNLGLIIKFSLLKRLLKCKSIFSVKMLKACPHRHSEEVTENNHHFEACCVYSMGSPGDAC